MLKEALSTVTACPHPPHSSSSIPLHTQGIHPYFDTHPFPGHSLLWGWTVSYVGFLWTMAFGKSPISKNRVCRHGILYPNTENKDQKEMHRLWWTPLGSIHTLGRETAREGPRTGTSHSVWGYYDYCAERWPCLYVCPWLLLLSPAGKSHSYYVCVPYITVYKASSFLEWISIYMQKTILCGKVILNWRHILFQLSWSTVFFPLLWVAWSFPGSSAGKEATCSAGDPSSITGLGRSPAEGIGYPLQYAWASLVVQVVKNPLAMQENWVWSLGWEDALEEGMVLCFPMAPW